MRMHSFSYLLTSNTFSDIFSILLILEIKVSDVSDLSEILIVELLGGSEQYNKRGFQNN